MKLPSNYLFVIKIVAILLLSLLAAWLFVSKLYFTVLLFLVAIVGISVSLHTDRKKLINRMERMIATIRNSDFSVHYPEENAGDELFLLSKEMDEALQVFRDRTQRSLMDEAETRAWQKLISVLTHEMMNSIAPIISLSETLSEPRADEPLNEEEYQKMKQAMETIYRRSKGLLVFVDNYRKLTRLPQASIQPIQVKSMLQSISVLMDADGVGLSTYVYPEQLVLKADRSMLDHLMLNLIKNAREACLNQEEAKISIKASKIGEEVQISVSDNGQGISPEAQEKIFIPFYSTKPNGSGIGLSICRQIMLRHKGRITLQSSENGSVFTLVFPDV